jgi:hypothetical protein
MRVGRATSRQVHHHLASRHLHRPPSATALPATAKTLNKFQDDRLTLACLLLENINEIPA